MTDPNTPTAERVFRDAAVSGTPQSLDALAAVGPAAVGELRAYLSGERKLPVTTARTSMDNLTAIAARLGAEYPDAYLETFNSPRWVAWNDVLTGLGYTGRPEARATLIEVLLNSDSWTSRVSAASALGHIPGPESVQALSKALGDDDSLVRYHAIRSLGEIGGEEALARLQTHGRAALGRGEAEAHNQAVAAIVERLRAKGEGI